GTQQERASADARRRRGGGPGPDCVNAPRSDAGGNRARRLLRDLHRARLLAAAIARRDGGRLGPPGPRYEKREPAEHEEDRPELTEWKVEDEDQDQRDEDERPKNLTQRLRRPLRLKARVAALEREEHGYEDEERPPVVDLPPEIVLDQEDDAQA